MLTISPPHTCIGDIGSLSIDIYTFSPEQHVLRIDFVDDFGSAGVFEYEFDGAVRPSKSHTALISSTDYTLFSYSVMHVETLNYIMEKF